MYIPSAFAETQLPVLQEFIERHSFGLLVSTVAGVPFATHLPFLLDRADGSHGVLVGHMARANPQAKELDGVQALAVFSGPHAYISPTWYEAENVVPTWNYTAVHVYGSIRLVQQRDSLLEIVERTTAVYEANHEKPWSLEANSAFVDPLLAQIVGFRLDISRIEGKFKLNQNHPVERRERVVRALQTQGGERHRAMADMIQATLGPKS